MESSASPTPERSLSDVTRVYLFELSSKLRHHAMSMQAKATIRLKLQSEKQLSSLMAALNPETHATATRRATAKLEKENHFLVLSVDAEDTVALRATLNAYLRWVNSALAVLENLEGA